MGAVAAAGYRSGWNPGTLHFLPRGGTSTPPAPQTPAALPAAALTTSMTMPSNSPSRSARGHPPGPMASSHDGLKSLLGSVLTQWGVNEDLSDQVVAAWPLGSDGTPDVPAIAARYQLSATRLPETTLDELRAISLPAILEMNDRSATRVYLLSRLDEALATLIAPSGEQARVPVEELDGSWEHSAWVIWRNVDALPVDPGQELTPIVVATLALRLQKLGLLGLPTPTSNTERFQGAVRRFQSSIGLTPDGIVGPRTTLALSRVVAGRFGPTLAGGSASSR